MIRVVIADDSLVAREYLVRLINSDPRIEVVGTASNGKEAVELVKRSKADVVTMDINMPQMNGLEATRTIMEEAPTRIIIVTASHDPIEAEVVFQALEAGALAVLGRPHGIGHPDDEDSAKKLLQTIKLMAEVKVVRRLPRVRREREAVQVPLPVEPRLEPAEIMVVAIGASTGGPVALQKILSGLPKDIPAPLMIVQHIAAGFIQGMAGWLGQAAQMPVHIATHGEILLPGHVYIAPDNFHMGVTERSRVLLAQGRPINSALPSASYLFRSVAEVFGGKAVGVLLTGMGKDGADALKTMREKGAVTIAQDEESCVVFGMPGEAVRLGAAKYVLSPDKIAAVLSRLANDSKQDMRPRVES